MDNRYGITRQVSGIWRSLRDGDFEEDDVWDVLTSIETHKKESISNSNSKIGKKPKESSSISVPRNHLSSSAARMIPRGANGSISVSSNSNNSSSNNETKMMMIQQSSAPVNIPADWSQIPNRKPTKKTTNSWLQDDDFDDDDDCYEQNSDEEGGGGGGYNCKLPPHEVIAKRLARSQISSFSVFEGVGRKLKGRDLSKVRNAVLVRTGFLESP